MNVDASFISCTNEGSIGVILQDNEGVLMRGQAIWWYGQSASALIMEAFAIRDGIKLPCGIGLSKIIIETDAKEVSIYGGTVLKVDQRYHPYFRRYKS